MYYCSLIYEPCLHKCAHFFVLPAMSQNLSASLEISLSHQAVYQHLLDNLVSGPSFIPTVIAAFYSPNRLWAPVCPDLLWCSQATSVDEKDLTSLPTCWGLGWSPCWILSCPQNLSQTSFSHISINSPSILTVSMATESPWKDLSIGTSHISRRSVTAEILGRSTGNHYGTVY